MKNNFISEIGFSVLLIILLLLLINPFGIWMPTGMQMIMLGGFIVAFALFAIFIWQEQAADEREAHHRMMADRIGFLVGAAVLVIGIVIENINHMENKWLEGTLIAMIAAKILGRIYSRHKY